MQLEHEVECQWKSFIALQLEIRFEERYDTKSSARSNITFSIVFKLSVCFFRLCLSLTFALKVYTITDEGSKKQ